MPGIEEHELEAMKLGHKKKSQMGSWQFYSRSNICLSLKKKFLRSVFPKSDKSCRGICSRAECRLTPLPIKVLSHHKPWGRACGPPGKAQGWCSAWWDAALGQMGRSDCRSPSLAPRPSIGLSLPQLSPCITTHLHPPH